MRTSVYLRLAVLAFAGIVLAGCDKCGNRVKFNTPTLPLTCGSNADPAK